MLRLSPPGFQRFTQASSFDAIYAGSEANVAVSLAQFGTPVDYITRLPASDIGDACRRFIAQYGVNTSKIVRGGDRLGIYFLETGAAQRGSKVVYDRANSSIAAIEPGMIDWKSVFADADWFHWSGITPALSKGAADVSLEAAKVAKEMGLTVSCDINYRAALWKWGKAPREVMPELLSYCDVILGLGKPEVKMIFGIDCPDSHAKMCEEISAVLPNVKSLAITFRDSYSASHNGLTGALWQAGKVYTSNSYDITTIIDRIGGGDAFTAGIIYGLKSLGNDLQETIELAVAASVLKHSIPGDFNLVSIDEVRRLMSGDGSGRVSR